MMVATMGASTANGTKKLNILCPGAISHGSGTVAREINGAIKAGAIAQ